MKFETVDDVRRQELAVRSFCNKYDFSYVPAEQWSSIDYQVLDRQLDIICGFEVKGCVNQNIGDKDIVLVSMRKLVDGQQFQTTHKKPLIMCWSFTDGILYERLNNLAGNFALGGRKPRAGSTYDIELMAYIKQKKLKKLLF